jgi:membrane associated rhomboid family serine protease
MASDMGGVAFFAHVGGFITGWVLVKLLTGCETFETSVTVS